MSPDGGNCGFVWPPGKELDRHTCICGKGYMNNEGTLIPGAIIREGYALNRKNYERHRNCKLCATDPSKCGWRSTHLEQDAPESTIDKPLNGRFEMFVPGKDVSSDVLAVFLRKNHDDGEWNYEDRKEFKVLGRNP